MQKTVSFGFGAFSVWQINISSDFARVSSNRFLSQHSIFNRVSCGTNYHITLKNFVKYFFKSFLFFFKKLIIYFSQLYKSFKNASLRAYLPLLLFRSLMFYCAVLLPRLKRLFSFCYRGFHPLRKRLPASARSRSVHVYHHIPNKNKNQTHIFSF